MISHETQVNRSMRALRRFFSDLDEYLYEEYRFGKLDIKDIDICIRVALNRDDKQYLSRCDSLGR